MKTKVTKTFSWTLMKQDLRSNAVITVIVLLMMCMMTVVISFAGNMLSRFENATEVDEAETEFYTYLYVLASYNDMAGTSLSYDDFMQTDDYSVYQTVFDMMNTSADMDLSVEEFRNSAEILGSGDIAVETYVKEFEYTYAFGNMEGCFSGEALDMQSMMATMLEMMGLEPDLLDNMANMDPSAMINEMYYTIMLILPVLLLIIVEGNALVVDKVDKGSMAFILATPTKRSAVVITQMLYMILVPLALVAIVCGVRMGAMRAFTGSVDVAQTLALYGGLYLLIEAMASICYFASCFFNLSRYAMGLGGGLNIWFFLASLLGLFGSDMMVNMGIGVESLGRFNNLTLIGLYDIEALGTVGSGDVNTAFIWKLCVLAAIAAILYIAGAVRFQKKDLPL